MPANGDETFLAERSDIDSTSVSWVVDTQPNHGRVYASSSGFRYTPSVGYFGKDRWQWHAYDGAASSATVTLEVNIHPPPSTEGRPEMPQIGLNKIQFGLGATAGDLDSATLPYRPDSIFDGFRDLGVQIFRQAARGDLVWSTVELTEGNFSDADANQIVSVPDVEPTCTLFEIQYAAPTPPWCEDISEFQKFMGPDAYDYLDHVLSNYGDSVGYYELGNEMYHWVAADPPVDNPDVLPGCYPTDGYSPSEQAVFIEEASRYVKEGDPGAVLTLSSVATDSDQAYAWLEDVMSTTGSTDWFDVVSYHAYDNWGRAYGTRDNFATELAALGLQDKLVKLTEYGSTSDADYTDRTDYPNSPESQCADVFRETLIGFGYGDATTIWHTYLPVTSASTGGEFQGFELVEYDGTWKPAAYTYQLLASELIPFKEITNYSSRSQYVYKVTTTDDEDRWVFWADGTTATIPSGVTEYTSVYPNSDGSFDWIPVSAGDQVPLTDTPILVR
jgi:hypothetical protein